MCGQVPCRSFWEITILLCLLSAAGYAQASQKPLSAVLLGHKLGKVFLPKDDSLVLERRDHDGSRDLTQRLEGPATRRQLNARRLGGHPVGRISHAPWLLYGVIGVVAIIMCCGWFSCFKSSQDDDDSVGRRKRRSGHSGSRRSRSRSSSQYGSRERRPSGRPAGRGHDRGRDKRPTSRGVIPAPVAKQPGPQQIQTEDEFDDVNVIRPELSTEMLQSPWSIPPPDSGERSGPASGGLASSGPSTESTGGSAGVVPVAITQSLVRLHTETTGAKPESTGGSVGLTPVSVTPSVALLQEGYPSAGEIEFPPDYGRNGVLRRDRKRLDTYTTAEEQKRVRELEREAKLDRNRDLEEGLGNRIPLKDVKLRCKQGRPILLGAGGYGKVFYGSLYKEACAVKVVLGASRREQARFLKEIKILERINSNYVTRYMGYSVCPDGLCLLMEYVPGGTLRHALTKENSEQQWYKKGRQTMISISLALCQLHGSRIVHMDLKSPNVLLTASGDAKLADVGLSKILTNDISMCSRPGSFPWTSTEQLSGYVCTGSDIWAFGTCLWEVCACQAPPMSRVLRELQVPEEAPQGVVDLIEKCHAQAHEDRPSASELHEMLIALPGGPEST